MKRILALLLCLIMVFSLFACGEESGVTTTTSSQIEDDDDTDITTPNSTSGGTTSSTRDEDTTDSTEDEGSGSTPPPQSSAASSSKEEDKDDDDDKPTTPTYTPDKTRYEPKTSGSGDQAVIYYVNEMAKFPVLTPYYNGYKTALTMTFDDGYDTNTGVVVSDLYEKYGMRGTMMIGPCFVGSDSIISEWNAIFDRGFLTVGCHGYNHKEPTTLDPSEYEHEIKDAIMFLREKFPGQRVLTFATPFAHINNSYEEYLSQFVIGNRLEAGGSSVSLSQNLDFNTYRIKAYSINRNSSASTVNALLPYAVEDGTWVVELYHCVMETAANSTDVDLSVFSSHCEYLYRNYRDTIWFATFEDVLIYAEQLRHTTIEYTACDRESLTFTVKPDGTLDKDIYNIPLTAKFYLPNDLVDSAYAMVNGVYQPLEYEADLSTGYEYVMVRDIPSNMESEVVIYIGGNKTMKNGCVHRYSIDSIVEPTHETHGYTVNKCIRCESTYKSAYTNPVHDYTGETVIVVEATRTSRGIAKHYCQHCDKYIEKEFLYTAE